MKKDYATLTILPVQQAADLSQQPVVTVLLFLVSVMKAAESVVRQPSIFY
ncbi:hypothetical protein FHS14_006582 [Paenibacillus baekrokdamisoli]|nr:hypothetical protein [Paenibacillus baekrokdamisoli]MBB3073523.1 hypothetical protein [Paenibacillus baekrokdamisoli]